MAEVWDEHLVRSKYHLSVAKRLFADFSNYETKRFLSSCLTEMAKSSASLVNSYLIYSHYNQNTRVPVSASARLGIFKKSASKKIGEELTKELLTIFEIKRAQKDSPIELLRKNKILLLDRGEYRALTIERMKTLLDNLEIAIKRFSQITKEL